MIYVNNAEVKVGRNLARLVESGNYLKRFTDLKFRNIYYEYISWFIEHDKK